MENNGNNGRGIFYGVIGVATLVVAIIGATFAYFSASANSTENAVTAGGAKVSLGWAEVKGGLKSNLVPLNPAIVTKPADVLGTTAEDCIDSNGNRICSVYQFTISNPDTNTAAQQVYASLVPQSNNFVEDTNGSGETNLKFAIFKGEAGDITSFNVTGTPKSTTAAVDGDLVVAATSIEGTNTIQLTNLNELIAIGGSSTYTVVIWINETGQEQNIDQGKSFAGGIFFTTAQGSNTGITGVITG